MTTPPEHALAWVVFAIALLGCEAEEESLPQEAQVIDVLERSCGFAACHGEGGGAGGLDLQPVFDGDASLYSAIAFTPSCQSDLPLMTPGRPEDSWLWIKLDPDGWSGGKIMMDSPSSSESECPPIAGTTDGMPPNSDGLAAEDLAIIRRWINGTQSE